MKEIEITWGKLNEYISQKKAELTDKENSLSQPLLLLFRGQKDSTWELQSTLEREYEDECKITKYTEIISNIFQKSRFKPSTNLTSKSKKTSHVSEILSNIEIRDYMFYLRHYGFPSPILDWSESIDIAAFFAFNEQPVSNFIAIYMYIESTNGMKCYAQQYPHIQLIQTTSEAHQRHINQEAHYTVCSKYIGSKELFCGYNSFFDSNQNIISDKFEQQDNFYKFILNINERKLILKDIETRGIDKEFLISLPKEKLLDDDYFTQLAKTNFI